MSIKHIVMWRVRGDDEAERAHNARLIQREFESLAGRIPGLLQLEVGLDESRIDYACDVVLLTEFDSRESLAAYAQHPEHLRVRQAIGDLRTTRHQVDYAVPVTAVPANPGIPPVRHTQNIGDEDHVQTL
jgi:heme-degrading monooxygenase HmoA